MMQDSGASKSRAGHRQRLRDRFLAGDRIAYTDEALLELLLTYALPIKDVQPLAEKLIGTFGSLSAVLTADPKTLSQIDGLDQSSAVLLKLVDWMRLHPSLDNGQDGNRSVISDGQLPLFDIPAVEPQELYKPRRPKRTRVSQQSKTAGATAVSVLPEDFAPVVTVVQVPASALRHGFSNGPSSPHSSRTMMLAELRLLLAVCPKSSSAEAYRTAAVDENVLLKPTLTTRRETYQRLRELYAVDERVPLFRALRELWDDDPLAQPLIAVLCAVARDPILRATTGTLLSLTPGTPVVWQMLEQAVSQTFPDRYNSTTRAAIAQHTLSTWRQSGHLGGQEKKVRTTVDCRPTAVAYALLLGYLCGERGEALFHTLWSRLLDAPTHILYEQALAASQRGWIEFRRAGSVTEVGFRHLLRTERQGYNR